MGPTLGQRLRALRVERGLSQADLASDLVSPSYVSLIEADRRSPERDVLEGLAQRLGCSALYLESGVSPEEINQQELRLRFAEIALANGELAEAQAAFSALSLHGVGGIRYAATWGLARTEEALGNMHAAITHTDVLVEASRLGEPGTPGLLSLLMSRCRIYRLAGDFARSIDVGEAALREVRDLGLDGSDEEIRLASTLVGSYWARGDMFSAQHLAAQTISKAEKLGSPAARGAAYWNACTVAAARGQLTLALELADKTLALISESSPDRSLAGMRVTYAWLLMRCDPPRLDEADAMLAQAHEVLADSSAGPRLANCETELARSSLLRGDYGQAIRRADQAVARCRDGGLTEVQHALVVRGLALIMSGDLQDGSAIVREAADRLAGLGSRLESAQAWRDLAEALVRRGQADQAITALRRAADCLGARGSSIRSDAALPVGD